jgi:hypothetical protein
MRIMSRVVLAFGVVALLVAVAPAQQPQRGQRGGGFGGIGALFDNKDVQKELNLTDDQVEKAKKVAEEVREKHKDDFDKLPQGQEGFQKRMELNKEVTDETMKQLADVLKPEQTKRLKQIQLQQTTRFVGPGIFLTPDVESALKLSDKQKDDLKTIAEDYRKEARELRGGGGGFNPETFQKLESMRKESMENALKVLDDKQKKEWEELNGAAFEIRFGRRPNRNQNQNDK